MRFSIELTEKAEEEFYFGIEYYESIQAGLGNRFRNAILEIFSYLKKNPFIFQVKYKEFREALAKPFPYLIVYEIIEKKIIIHSIFFCTRDPNNKYTH